MITAENLTDEQVIVGVLRQWLRARGSAGPARRRAEQIAKDIIAALAINARAKGGK